MTWDDLAALGDRHVVAAHTARHAALEDLATAADVRRELVEPHAAIGSVTGTAPVAIALRRGAAYDPADPAWRPVLDAGYRFVVSNTAVQRIARPA